MTTTAAAAATAFRRQPTTPIGLDMTNHQS